MGVSVATRLNAPQRADPQRSGPRQAPGGPCAGRAPVQRLQRAVGNRAINRLLRSYTIQPKLTISEPGDEYEREADRVADQVMRMPDGQGAAMLRIGNSSVVQRKCACDAAGGAPCECVEGTQTLQRSADSSANVSSVPRSIPQVLRSSGRPLDRPTMSFMESRFRQDLSAVRVHTMC